MYIPLWIKLSECTGRNTWYDYITLMDLFTSLEKSNLGRTSSYAAQQRSNKVVENTWESGQNRKGKQSLACFLLEKLSCQYDSPDKWFPYYYTLRPNWCQHKRPGTLNLTKRQKKNEIRQFKTITTLKVTTYTKSFLLLTHCGPVTQICVFTLQLCKTDDANLRF